MHECLRVHWDEIDGAKGRNDHVRPGGASIPVEANLGVWCLEPK